MVLYKGVLMTVLVCLEFLSRNLVKNKLNPFHLIQLLKL